MNTQQPGQSQTDQLRDGQIITAETHQVFNQPSPLENYNAFTSNNILLNYVEKFGGVWGEQKLANYGHQVGHELLTAGFSANSHKPEFQSHDRFGNRIDQVKYHPAYHQLMKAAINAGHHNIPWTNPEKGTHVVRAALEYLHTQADPGSGCPLTMTFAAVPALKHQPDIAEKWLPKVLSNEYDPDNRPFFEKNGLTIGMAMTEKQGGSDVRANTTRAFPIGEPGPGKAYELVGHKWFCSAPMCDAFLVLANTNKGLSCFLLPRWKPDGHKNEMHIQRLKNKMGNVSNASSEVEFRGAFAWMIGEDGRGVRTILEMVAMTRFDCMVGSSAIMGLAAAQALHHTGGREVFGKNLHQQPLMQNVLADLALESEAALAISMRLAYSLDHQEKEHEQLLFRLGTAIGKYWICKRTPQHTYEAMESIGGVAVVEDNVLARLYRESPINAIWEGSGNVQCLDVARAMTRTPKVIEAFIAEQEKAVGQIKCFDQQLSTLKNQLASNKIAENQLRILVEKMAILWQASSLIQFSEDFVAEAFVENRLKNTSGNMYGTLNENVSFTQIIERAKPAL
ncbi:acyl-CoA dehydrogenase family protein [Aliikangiella coralliicola]|uniref:DNA alkylation response protein n=1 Tax=Aliikangiella coralliicola TaxID=2592383 RepID=A0A545UBS3_9GAMM|nr:acyl-CoA dehydrogenase family protein [Aliikangiella coralliicola]TQV86921.1 DNA alkylation response protein [Aliikangiella coralliicola]